jgi:hypothetical protein
MGWTTRQYERFQAAKKDFYCLQYVQISSGVLSPSIQMVAEDLSPWLYKCIYTDIKIRYLNVTV